MVATLAGEPHLWWGHCGKHGWVVMFREDPRNNGEQRHLLRCRDWSEVVVSRQQFGSDQFVWFKKYIPSLPEDKRSAACEQLLAFRKEFVKRLSSDNEREWLSACRPEFLMASLKAASVRKARLFAIACCRRVWHLMDFEDCRQAVQLAERLVEGEATVEEAQRTAEHLRQTMETLDPTFRGPKRGVRVWSIWAARKVLADAEPRTPDRPSDSSFGVLGARESVLDLTSHASVSSYDGPPPRGPLDAENRAQADLIREVLGNPYRPVVFDASWRTPDVLYLAQAVYAERAFDQMPILADALEEAGCSSSDLLEHLRRRGAPHVRGCWALDLVLDRL